MLSAIAIDRTTHTHFTVAFVFLWNKKLMVLQCYFNAKIIAHMPTFGKKKRFTDYLYTKGGIAVLLVVVALLSMAVYKRFTVAQEMTSRRKEADEQKQLLIERKNELQNRVQYLSGDRGTEEEIRKDFNVAKDGEKVIILVGDDTQNTASSATATPPVRTKPWYQFW